MARKKTAPVTDATGAPAIENVPHATRIYEVMNAETGVLRMIETTSQARALRFVSKDLFSVKVANARDVARNFKAGIVVEEDAEAAATE